MLPCLIFFLSQKLTEIAKSKLSSLIDRVVIVVAVLSFGSNFLNILSHLESFDFGVHTKTERAIALILLFIPAINHFLMNCSDQVLKKDPSFVALEESGYNRGQLISSSLIMVGH